MSDAAVKTPKKKASKPKVPAAHPKYSEMIAKAISALKERGGSSRQAVLKYIVANFSVGSNVNAVNSRLKAALRTGVKNGSLKQAKGTGAAGSFRLGEKKAAAVKKPKSRGRPKAAGEKKPKVKKPKAKKPAGEKAKRKKPASPKKPKAAKAAKPKKPKTPKKAKAAKPKKAAKAPKKK